MAISRHASLILILSALTLPITGNGKPDPINGQLILFTRPAETPMWMEFEEKSLPQIRALAEKLDAQFVMVDTEEKGAPAEVHLAPLVVFQNYKGRSIFQGRYGDLENLEHFVRTARFIPRPEVQVQRQNLPVMHLGRLFVGSPLKVTPLEGEVPADFDQEAFQKDALQAIPRGFSQYRMTDTTSFGRSDRLFYMDYYPIAVEDGALVISLSLFSQFNCHTPVFTAWEDEIRGPMAESAKLWMRAGAMMEKEVLNQMRSSTIGDGFLPLGPGLDTVTWEELGLALPPAPDPADRTIPEGVSLPTKWEIVPEPIDGTPLLAFRFASPLDNYTGSADTLAGELTLGPDNSIIGSTGYIEVPIAAITMGVEDLDSGIRNDLLYEKFPTARFNLETMSTKEAGPLGFEAARMIEATGTFTMMGHSIPMEVTGELDPVVDEEGKPQLQVVASFSLPIGAPFNLEGPPGPSPENSTLEFFLRFPMGGR